jgi:glycosidase
LRDLVRAAHDLGLYVILDIVLNHAGDVFDYDGFGSEAPYANDDGHYAIHWRNADGSPNPDWPAVAIDPPSGAAVLPRELANRDLFRCKGDMVGTDGDFDSLKQFRNDNPVVRNTLIRAYQYLIAKFDIDGLRIDTLRYIGTDFAHNFGNAMREFAYSIGKKNFFTFGEVWDGDVRVLDDFIGRSTKSDGDTVGVDAALDFPVCFALRGLAKNTMAPAALASMFQARKQAELDIVSSHGEASRYFVTFLDNHDLKERLRYEDPQQPHRYDDQVTLGIGLQYALQGVPCLYYGTEQGLSGRGSDELVREALWGKPGTAFDTTHPLYLTLSRLAAVRAKEPALRAGRQYFRPISGDGYHFGPSPYPDGIVAFSRILNDREVLVVANLSTTVERNVEVVVDQDLTPQGTAMRVLASNKDNPSAPAPAVTCATAVVDEPVGSTGTGPLRTVRVTLQPMEVQYLGS